MRYILLDCTAITMDAVIEFVTQELAHDKCIHLSENTIRLVVFNEIMQTKQLNIEEPNVLTFLTNKTRTAIIECMYDKYIN